jgi:hypothetical protein
MDGGAGFAIHQTGEGGFAWKIPSPVGFFTAELGKVIQPPQKCLILTV